MMRKTVQMSRALGERGFSVLELLVGMLLMIILTTPVLGSFVFTSKTNMDQQRVNRVNEQARTILDYMAYDLRMMGAGMPLGQSAFPIVGGLGTAPLPIFLTSSATNISFRLNERGISTILSATFTPTAAGRTFSVLSTADFGEGDTIYISDVTEGGGSGLQGIVEAVNANSITIAAGFTATAGASFASGSVVNRVTTVTYNSPNDWSGITRDAEAGAVSLGVNSQFTVSYLDAAGNALVLPLTTDSIANQLTSVRLTVSTQDTKPRSDGSLYSTDATQVVALRNLILMR